MSEAASIEVVVSGPSNAISSHEHPILESGNLSFPKGRYMVSFDREADGYGFQLTHRLEGAPLLTRLIQEKKAKFVCIVSSPRSAYRQIHQSFESRQAVAWDANELGEPPLFTPAVVCVCDSKIDLDSERDGVHEIWNGQRVQFTVGSRLALGNVIQLEASITHLLSLHADDAQKKGGFAIGIEAEPFGFRANLHPELHRFARYGADGAAKHNLMVHIVTACLARLQRDYSDDDADDGEGGWESHRSLKALADRLSDRGLPHWADDEFRPEEVATALHPLRIPVDDLAIESDDGE
ncbi:MAG: hypothetical protein OXF68_16180 [Gammaproteobacteria bacterium]|nr:hypothetical protein [Gammaproteobacteria bacterium]